MPDEPVRYAVYLRADRRDLIILALTKYLAEVRREYEDAFDVGANVDDIRKQRDLIKETIELVRASGG